MEAIPDKNSIVYSIFDRETDKIKGVYGRAYHNEYSFSSLENARSSNFHGIYEDKDKYKVNKYKVSYTLLEEDVQ